MGERNLRAGLEDLERTDQLVRSDQEVDGDLEVAEIQRRVYAAGRPAALDAFEAHAAEVEPSAALATARAVPRSEW